MQAQPISQDTSGAVSNVTANDAPTPSSGSVAQGKSDPVSLGSAHAGEQSKANVSAEPKGKGPCGHLGAKPGKKFGKPGAQPDKEGKRLWRLIKAGIVFQADNVQPAGHYVCACQKGYLVVERLHDADSCAQRPSCRKLVSWDVVQLFWHATPGQLLGGWQVDVAAVFDKFGGHHHVHDSCHLQSDGSISRVHSTQPAAMADVAAAGLGQVQDQHVVQGGQPPAPKPQPTAADAVPAVPPCNVLAGAPDQVLPPQLVAPQIQGPAVACNVLAAAAAPPINVAPHGVEVVGPGNPCNVLAGLPAPPPPPPPQQVVGPGVAQGEQQPPARHAGPGDGRPLDGHGGQAGQPPIMPVPAIRVDPRPLRGALSWLAAEDQRVRHGQPATGSYVITGYAGDLTVGDRYENDIASVQYHLRNRYYYDVSWWSLFLMFVFVWITPWRLVDVVNSCIHKWFLCSKSYRKLWALLRAQQCGLDVELWLAVSGRFALERRDPLLHGTLYSAGASFIRNHRADWAQGMIGAQLMLLEEVVLPHVAFGEDLLCGLATEAVSRFNTRLAGGGGGSCGMSPRTARTALVIALSQVTLLMLVADISATWFGLKDLFAYKPYMYGFCVFLLGFRFCATQRLGLSSRVLVAALVCVVGVFFGIALHMSGDVSVSGSIRLLRAPFACTDGILPCLARAYGLIWKVSKVSRLWAAVVP